METELRNIKSPIKKNTRDSVILNAVQVDYLRITSFDMDTLVYIEDTLNAIQDEQGLKKGSTEARLMQYEGYRIDSLNLFIGKGLQARSKGLPKQDHYLLDIAGSFAHEMYDALVDMSVEQKYDFRVPRIDIQKSMSQARFYQLFGVDEATMFQFLVNSKKEDWFGAKPRIEYTSDLSVGLGNRKSGLYRRIYRKETVEPTVVRFETEFHNDLGYQVFIGNLEGLFGKSWVNFPKRYNLSVLAAPETEDWARKKTTVESRVAWLNSNIFPMLIKDMARFDAINNSSIAVHIGNLQKTVERAYYVLGKLEEED
jgi:hypothetical protein